MSVLHCYQSPWQVFGAIKQAVQHAPHFPESHNLHGLVCEARFDYQSAAAAYRLARCAISSVSSNTRDISLNLARSLCKVNILDLVFAVRFCRYLTQNTFQS